MSYRFTIQASNPRQLAEFDSNDTNLSDAVQTVFPLDAECALLVWNWLYVPLTYKYDLSMMIDDIVGLVDAMLEEPSGHRTIQWPSNTFAATWKIKWGSGVTEVEAEWISVVGETEALLTAKPKVILDSSGFIGEWRRPLEVILAALTSAGYGSALIGMDKLSAVVSRIGCRGLLYRD